MVGYHILPIMGSERGFVVHKWLEVESVAQPVVPISAPLIVDCFVKEATPLCCLSSREQLLAYTSSPCGG